MAIGVSPPQPDSRIPTYQGGIAEAGAADMARGFGKLGDDIRSVADRFQDRENETWARDTSTKLMLDMNSAAEQYRKLEGTDATKGYDAHVQALEAMRNKALGTAPSPAAAKMLADQSSFVLGRLVAGSQAYSAQQFKAGQERSHTAAASAITTTAVNQQNDPTMIRQSEAAIRRTGLELAAARGLHGADADAAAAVEVGKFYKTLLTDMAAGDVGKARTLFDQVKGRMDGASQAAISQMLKTNGDSQAANRAAMESYAPGAAPTGDYADRIIQRESGNRPDMKDPGSSAAGYGGFINATWTGFARANPAMFAGKTPAEIQAMRSDRNLARQAIDWYAEQNTPVLRAAGVEPTKANLAVAHVGPGNAIKIIKADPNAMASTVLPADVMAANPAWQRMTAGQLRHALSAGFDNGPAPAPGPPGASNNLPDHTGDRANAMANLWGKFQRNEITETQFFQALPKVQQLLAVDTKLRADAAEEALNGYIPQALSAPGTFPMDKMLADTRLTGLQKQHVYDIVNKALRGNMDKPTEISQNRRTELLDGIRNGTVTTPDQILDAVAHGGLSTADYSFVKARFDEAQTDNGRSLNRQTTELFGAVEKDIAATLVPGLSNPAAGLDFYRFKAFAYQKIAEAQKAGKVGALFDPASPDFLGSEANIKQFKSSLDDVMRNRMSGLAQGGKTPDPSGQPRAPVDTPALSEQDQLRADVQAGKITRAEGARIAREKGWIKAAPGTASNPADVRPNMVPTTP